MSLFIASLAFEGSGEDIRAASRVGIMVGTLLSAALGLAVLHRFLPRARAADAKRATGAMPSAAKTRVR